MVSSSVENLVKQGAALVNGRTQVFGREIVPYEDPWYRFTRVLELVEQSLTIPRGAKWLDAGCQVGEFLALVASRFNIEAHGIDDYSPADRDSIAQTYRGFTKSECENLNSLAWKYHERRIEIKGFDLGERFDVISALEIIEHMVDTDEFLKTCYSHLSKQGFLILSTPNINSLRNRLTVPFGRYPAGLEYRNIIHHVRLYNLTSLVTHANKHKLKLVAHRAVNVLPARLLRTNVGRQIDNSLALRLTTLGSSLLAIFQRTN